MKKSILFVLLMGIGISSQAADDTKMLSMNGKYTSYIASASHKDGVTTLTPGTVFSGEANAGNIQQHDKCRPDGLLGKTKTGTLMSCQKGQMDYPAFGLVNVHLTQGQIAQDPAGCLYIVTEDKNRFALSPFNGDDGKPVCK